MSLVAMTMSAMVGIAAANADSYRIGNDSSSTSWYPDQTQLTPSAVAGGTFGQRFDASLGGGMIYAQPLVSNGVVLAVTENGDAYGLDATTGAQIWTDSFTPTATPAVQGTSTCGDIGPSIGITGTPVIDPATGVAYFVAARGSGAGGATQYWMEAVYVANGTTPAFWPAGGVLIHGSANNDAGTTFNATYQTQRPGLVLVNGVVYAAFSAQCDYIPPTGQGTYAGWLIGINATSGALTSLWATEIRGTNGGGIWQSGAAPVVDSQGNIYVITGNGWANNTLPTPGPGTRTISYFGEGVVELSTTSGVLTPVDWFIPQNAAALNSADLDFGSGGPVALPASMGTPQQPNVLLGVGKEGILYSLDMAHLGGYQDGSGGGDNIPSETNIGGGVWGKPAVWPGDGGYLYVNVTGGNGNEATGTMDVLQRVASASGAVGFQEVASTGTGSMGFTSGSPIVTSNQSTSGSSLVWVIHANDASGAGGQLQAYDPVPQNPGANGVLHEVWSSTTFSAEKYTQPGVGDAMIYVGTRDGQLLGFGFGSATPVLTGNNVDFPATVISQSTPETATFTASAATTVESFALSGTDYALGTSSPATPVSLSAGQSITVPVTFTPSAFGTRSGTLTANTTTAGSSAATTVVTLSGVGLGAATVVASPVEADFSTQPIGGATVSIPVTMTNTTASPITITGFIAPLGTTPFSVTGAPAANQILTANASVTFSVNFSPPGSSGNYAHVYGSVATLETSIGNFGVPLSGSANPPAQLAVVPSPLAFGDVTVGHSPTLQFTVENNGSLPLTITGSTPPTTNGFSALTTLSASTVIPANSSIPETVQFTPTTTGAVTSSWSITSDVGSLSLSLTGSGIDVPGSPTNVAAIAGNALADVSWSAPSSDGGSSITKYTVTANDVTSGSGGGQTCSTSGATSCTVTGLVNGDSYAFSVVATNAVGDGPASTASTAVTPEVPATLALSVSTLPFASVQVGSTKTLTFNVENLGGLPLTVTGSTPPTTNGFTALTTLAPGTVIPADSSVQETVQFAPTSPGAVSENWTITSDGGSQSLSLSATGILNKPGVPTNVAAVAGNAQANVLWTAPTSDGGSPIDKYVVTATDATSSSRGGQTCTTLMATSCTVTGLTNLDAYTFIVVAHNLVGDGAASSPSTNVVPASPPSLQISPSSLTFTGVQVGQVTSLTFSVTNTGDRPLTITSAVGPTSGVGFTALTTLAPGTVIAGNSSVQETVQFAPTSALSVSDSWVVSGNDGRGAQTLTIVGAGVINQPGAPTGVTAIAADAAAHVSWVPPSSSGGGAINGYAVTATDLSDAARGGMTCDPLLSQASCTVVGLTNGDHYAFSVIAFNSAGHGPSSGPSASITPERASLIVTSRRGHAGTDLVLTTRGDELGGALSFAGVDGTARGCRVAGATLVSRTGGTCVVVAYRLASAYEPATSSTATVITMSGPVFGVHRVLVEVLFASASATLSQGATSALTALAKSLRPGATLVITGFARGDPSLARARATTTSRFLTKLFKVHARLVPVTTSSKDAATIWASKA